MKPILFFFLLISLSAEAQWNSDPYVRTALTSAGKYYLPKIVNGNSANYYVTWLSFNSFTVRNEVRGQQLDSAGYTMWSSPKTLVYGNTFGPEYEYTLVPGNHNDGYIFWQRNITGCSCDETVIQHFNSNGDTLVRVMYNGHLGGSYFVTETHAIPDGRGGVISAWVEKSTSFPYYIRAQKADSLLNFYWPTTGAVIPNIRYLDHFVSDSQGGAFCLYRNLSFEYEIQRINSSGNVLPVPVSLTDAFSYVGSRSISICPDSISAGCYVSFADTTGHLYLQHIDSTGNFRWTPPGISLAYDPGLVQSYFPKIASDRSGGVYCRYLMQDSAYALTARAYVQRYNSTGVPQWQTQDTLCHFQPISNDVFDYTKASLLPLSSGGVINIWEERFPNNLIINSQKFDANGNKLWVTNGAPVTLGQSIVIPGGYEINHEAVASTDNNAVVVWADNRTSQYSYTVFVAKADGTFTTAIGDQEIDHSSVMAYPVPASDVLMIEIPAAENIGACKLEIFNSVGQKIDFNYLIQVKYFSVDVKNLPSGIYYVIISGDKTKYRTKFVK